MTHDERLEQAAAFLRLAGSSFTEAARQRCADALDALREELARQEPVGWRVPASPGMNPSHFNSGKPSDRDITYWRNEGVELDLAYASPQPAQATEGWRVVYDGDSMPMVTDDIGRLFRVQQNLCGKWTHPHSPQELADRLAAPQPKEKS